MMSHARLLSVTFIFGIVMLRKVHQIYGATGATFAKAMSEGQGTFNTAVWSNQHVRNAAQEAATQAASHAAQVIFFIKIKVIYYNFRMPSNKKPIKKHQVHPNQMVMICDIWTRDPRSGAWTPDLDLFRTSFRRSNLCYMFLLYCQ